MNKEDIILLKQELEKKYGLGKLEETHISWVIVTPKYAFKIKKPVKTTFLDFSDLEKREHYCRQELELNQRYSPDIYLNICYIYKNDIQFYISDTDEEKPVVEYAVKMHALPSDNLFSNMLKNQKIDDKHIVNLALALARFHNNEKPIAFSPDIGKLQSDFNDIQDCKATIIRTAPEEFHDLVDQMISFSDHFLMQNAGLIQERADRGYYKDLHGDLHTGNIFIIKDQPILFDCIEFNDRFRKIDVLNEVAFLCMDLEAQGFTHFSELLLDKYLSVAPCIRNENERILMNYYKIYKANVRLKVAISSGQNYDVMFRYLKLISEYLRKFKI